MRVREQDLPACVRYQLEAARALRPAHEVECIEFHTRESGRVTAQMGSHTGVGLDPACRLSAKDMLVLSVGVTETTFGAVHTAMHVLIALIRPRFAVTRRRGVDEAKPMYGRDR